MIIRTRNSIYELDEAAKRVRRLSGVNDPTPLFGTDGQWRQYAELIGLEVGRGLLIRWNDRHATHTSAVMAIEPSDVGPQQVTPASSAQIGAPLAEELAA